MGSVPATEAPDLVIPGVALPSAPAGHCQIGGIKSTTATVTYSCSTFVIWNMLQNYVSRICNIACW